MRNALQVRSRQRCRLQKRYCRRRRLVRIIDRPHDVVDADPVHAEAQHEEILENRPETLLIGIITGAVAAAASSNAADEREWKIQSNSTTSRLRKIPTEEAFIIPEIASAIRERTL